MHNQYQKLLRRYFAFFFGTKSLRSCMHIILTAQLNLNAKFSSEIFDMLLEFIKYTTEKVKCTYLSCFKHTKSFQGTKASVKLKILY